MNLSQKLIATGLVLLLLPIRLPAGDLTVEWDRADGRIRALQGGNDGPIQRGGLVDLTDLQREIGIPFTRLHDCDWPCGNVVDMHAVFPNAKADPASPDSYDFARTDDYIAAVLKTGSHVTYRLGESIEHTARKYHVNPPADSGKWAAQCVGIIRHYNEGWAGGFHDDIQYWEIWNEPENRPSCWTGSDEDYFHLYGAAAAAIKQRWPGLKVGGPSLGYTGRVEHGRFMPGEFLLRFLGYCKQNKLPLDFFSWHLYGNDPAEYRIRARGIRATLDQFGFMKTESRLNEWNYLPDNQWLSLGHESQGLPRQQYYDRATGAEGAAFAASVLIVLQDSPVEMTNFFAANTQPLGLFDRFGTPHKNYWGFKAFRQLLDTPQRVRIEGDARGMYLCAGLNAARSRAGLLVANPHPADGKCAIRCKGLPWNGATKCEVFRVDAHHNLEPVADLHWNESAKTFDLAALGWSVSLVVLREAGE